MPEETSHIPEGIMVRDCRKILTDLYRSNGFDSPEIEASYLLEDVTGIRHNLTWCSEKIMSAAEILRAEAWLKRRLAQEPYQYICGWTEFRELRLSVGPGCLIPRPETELLVDLAFDATPRGGSAAELGTGSGAIILSFAQERPDVKGLYASELSEDALKWALKNRHDLGFDARVEMRPGDLFAPFSAGLRFHTVVANLPYIAEEERGELPANVRDYEPAQALFAPDHGFALLERAIMEAPGHLYPGGTILLEMGETQGARCLKAAEECGYASAEICKDQYGVDRFFRGRL